MDIKESKELIDDSPENRIPEEEIVYERNWLSTIILTVVLLLCVLGFSYGLYQVLH
jgi:hypothetical protein